MEILSVRSPTYLNGLERQVMIRASDSDVQVMPYSRAVTEVYHLSQLQHQELFCLYLDTSDLPNDRQFCVRPFMIVRDGKIQAVGSDVTPEMLIEEAVPAFHVTNFVYDAHSEVSVSGLRKNDRGNCQHYKNCLAEANHKNKEHVCPPTCSTFYPELLHLASDQTNMDE